MRFDRALLIANPASRRGRRWFEPARAELRRYCATCDAVMTAGPGDAAVIATRGINDYDVVFTLGGDGTAIEVIGALSGSNIPVGVIPGGTGNLMVRALGIPLGLHRAIRTLVFGEVARIDLGRLHGGPHDGRRFAIGVGVGIDARMIETASPVWKRRLGILAYVASGTAAVLRRERFGVTVTVDGRVMRHEAAVALVANMGTLLHGLVTLGPGIRSDDGTLDVCIFDPQSIRDSVRITAKLMARDFAPDPAMAHYSGRTITLATDTPRTAQADGDLIGSGAVQIVAEPLAGCILVPKRISCY